MLRMLARRIGLARDVNTDDGSLVLTLVLIAALSALAVVSVSSVMGAIPTATQSVQGADAVAQAHTALSDALFRLDQMGDNSTSFCVGTPPDGTMPSDLTSSECSPSGAEPLGSTAPGVRYYIVDEVAGTLPLGVTNELQFSAYAVARGQSRTVTATLYEEANRYGFFGVDGFTDDGALKNAAVATVGGSTAESGSVLFGGGQNSNVVCNGVTGGVITVTGETGALLSSKCAGTSTSSNLEPAAPGICSANQLSTAFAPCIGAGSTTDFASIGGVQYCPLPGFTVVSGVNASNVSSGPNTVFNCSTNGAAYTLSPTSLPYGLTSIPSGNYYFDSNALTLGSLPASYLANSTVHLFVLPQYCQSVSCAVSVPSSTTAATACPGNTNTTLTISGLVNYTPGASKNSAPTPGDPGSLSLYWEAAPGSSLDGEGGSYDGVLYAPNGDLTSHGNNGMSVYGSLVLGCWTVKGGPNLTFAYPFHDDTPVLGWTIASYRISA
jgi:hypothetical protein